MSKTYEVWFDGTNVSMSRFVRAVAATGSRINGKFFCLQPGVLACGPARGTSIWASVTIEDDRLEQFKELSKAGIKPLDFPKPA